VRSNEAGLDRVHRIGLAKDRQKGAEAGGIIPVVAVTKLRIQ
jgi:hypothetical protein